MGGAAAAPAGCSAAPERVLSLGHCCGGGISRTLQRARPRGSPGAKAGDLQSGKRGGGLSLRLKEYHFLVALTGLRSRTADCVARVKDFRERQPDRFGELLAAYEALSGLAIELLLAPATDGKNRRKSGSRPLLARQ